MTFSTIVLASILNSNLSNIHAETERLAKAGVDAIHFDVMDGIFVDNISFGLPVLSSLRKITDIPIDVHLMIQQPDKFIERFAKAGADMISFHIESESDTQQTINLVHSCGIPVGVAISPDTSIESVYPFLPSLDQDDFVLIMTVYPGLGGQAFMNEMLLKIDRLQKYKMQNTLSFHIEVDGGINDNTAKLCRENGVDYLVAGSYLTGAVNPVEAVRKLKRLAGSKESGRMIKSVL